MTPIRQVIVEFVEAGGNLLPVLVEATQIQGRTPFLLLPQAQHTLLQTSPPSLYRTLRPLQAIAQPMQDHQRIPRRPQAWARPLRLNLLGDRVTSQGRRPQVLVRRVELMPLNMDFCPNDLYHSFGNRPHLFTERIVTMSWNTRKIRLRTGGNQVAIMG